MATWDTTFEAQPGNGFNPGGGAGSIRDVKYAIRERLERSHYWGENEGLTQGELGGQHMEGAARIFVLDGSEDDRDDMSTPNMSSDAVGLIEIDVTEVTDTTRRKQDEEWLDDVAGYTVRDQARRTIKITCTDPLTGETAKTTVLDYDKLVDTIVDQTILGIKSFTSAPLCSETVVIDDDYDVEDAEKLVRAEQINAFGIEGKYHNLFDPEDADNIASDEVDILDGVVQKDIKCRTVEADALIGAVWV